MRILYVGATCPFGEISGAGLRTLNLLRLLERVGEVTAVFSTGRDWSAEQMEETRDAFNVALVSRQLERPVRGPIERYRKFFDPRFLNTNGVLVPDADREKVASLVEQHDVVWVHTLKVANSFRRFRWPKSVLDADDFPSRFHRSAAGHEPTLRGRLMRRQRSFSWKRHERLCLDRFGIVTVCKEVDREAFGGDPRIHVIPNGFTAPDRMPDPVSGPALRLGMIGDFNYLPNRDGVRWFIDSVWPTVREGLPGAELRLVGKGSDAVAAAFPDRGISGLGYVRDIDAEVASWCATIVPTRVGGGTHLKVAEGLARRVPIVTTSHGARGYGLESGTHAYVVDEPGEFARCCVRLLGEPDLGRQISEAGWKLFEERYSWDSIRPAVEGAVDHCIRLGRDGREPSPGGATAGAVSAS